MKLNTRSQHTRWASLPSSQRLFPFWPPFTKPRCVVVVVVVQFYPKTGQMFLFQHFFLLEIFSDKTFLLSLSFYFSRDFVFVQRFLSGIGVLEKLNGKKNDRSCVRLKEI